MGITLAERYARAVTRWDRAVAAVSAGRTTMDRSRWLLTSSRAVLDRPRPRFSGGADVPVRDEEAVRALLWSLIESGFLPLVHSGRLLIAPCRACHDCTICRVGIRIGEQEVEIFSSTGAVVIHLHRRCFDIWTREAKDRDRPPRG